MMLLILLALAALYALGVPVALRRANYRETVAYRRGQRRQVQRNHLEYCLYPDRCNKCPLKLRLLLFRAPSGRVRPGLRAALWLPWLCCWLIGTACARSGRRAALVTAPARATVHAWLHPDPAIPDPARIAELEAELVPPEPVEPLWDWGDLDGQGRSPAAQAVTAMMLSASLWCEEHGEYDKCCKSPRGH